ncbi:MAG: hypothetical protein ACLP8A_15600 [Methylovirgula sp.]
MIDEDDEDDEDVEHGIYHVMHTLIVGGERRTVENDFILQGDQLLLVLEWIHRPEGDLWPAVTLPLDEDLLEEDPKRPGRFLYSGKLVDPRSVQ